jgi:hypothetical protein
MVSTSNKSIPEMAVDECSSGFQSFHQPGLMNVHELGYNMI